MTSATVPSPPDASRAAPLPPRRLLATLGRHPPAQALVVAAATLLACAAVTAFRGFPLPSVHDEFAYLLAGETYAAGRLTNPAHPLWPFFETFHVLAQPTYMAKYPPAQGLALALAATGGALLLGGTLRVARRGPARGTLLAAAAGLSLLALSRPFEGLLLLPVPAWLLLRRYWQRQDSLAAWGRALWPGTLVGLAALAFLLASNRAVTGSAFRLPYGLYEAAYSSAPVFTWQAARPAPEFRHPRMEQFDREVSRPMTERAAPLVQHVAARCLDNLAFFLGNPLPAVVLILAGLRPTRRERLAWAAAAGGAVAIAATHWNYPHYLAPFTGAVVLAGTGALRRLHLVRLPGPAGAARHAALAAALALLVVARLLIPGRIDKTETLLRLERDRADLLAHLASQPAPAGHLVVVTYAPGADPHVEWVFNGAAIDDQPVIWARDMGLRENRTLLARYPQRRRWVLAVTPDGHFLQPYPAEHDIGAPAPSADGAAP